LDWAVFEPDLLVTSSVDTYIYIWDIKDTRKPTVALSAVAGASQVKWNKKNANCLATSHDGDVRIWDKRKPSTAVEYLAAHLSKIHGLDWHPDIEHVLATSSQDNSVKVSDPRGQLGELRVGGIRFCSSTLLGRKAALSTVCVCGRGAGQVSGVAWASRNDGVAYL